MTDIDVTPVIFRKNEDEIVAVFPTEPGTHDGTTMTCFAHIGQHASCAFDWYSNDTQPARPDEYAELKTELESAPYEYKLKVYQRITRQHREEFNAALRRYKAA